MTSSFAPPTRLRTAAARRVRLAPVPHPDPAPRPTLDLPTVVDLAVGLAAAPEVWRPHVDHDPLSRTGVRLIATPAYEVWLLGWMPEQRVELHDHGGAHAAFVVLEGRLAEVTLGPSGTRTVELEAGDVGRVPRGTIHDVVHRGSAPATSLHVYSDPLRSMTFYDRHGVARHREDVEEVPALLSAPATARAVHPAGGPR